MKLSLTIPALAIACAIIAGCANGNKTPAEAPDGAEVGNSQPLQGTNSGNFLYTGYEPLEKWMDERFKVRYENMPLKMVFDQQPISDIRYKYVSLPENTPVFQLISPSISRREILREIANYFNLEMQVDMVDGKPSTVVVRGQGGQYRPVSGSSADPYFSPTDAF